MEAIFRISIGLLQGSCEVLLNSDMEGMIKVRERCWRTEQGTVYLLLHHSLLHKTRVLRFSGCCGMTTCVSFNLLYRCGAMQAEALQAVDIQQHMLVIEGTGCSLYW